MHQIYFLLRYIMGSLQRTPDL